MIDAEIVPALTAAASDSETEVRAAVAKALGYSDGAALDALALLSRDDVGEVRNAALTALGDVECYMQRNVWVSYDPSPLIEMVRERYTESPDVADALACCTSCVAWSTRRLFFVDPSDANDPGAEWQYDKSIALGDQGMGTRLHLLQDGRVGGVDLDWVLDLRSRNVRDDSV